MNIFGHPSKYIEPSLAEKLRDFSQEAERLKQLHSAQLGIVREQKWFRIFVPKQYNGLELTLPEALRVEESLAWTDGSLGWTVTLCAGAGWFIGFLEPEIVSTVFKTNQVCLAGSGKSSGVAKKIPDGYEITGKWDYATGANHATAFTANCIIEEDGTLLNNEDGSPLIQSFLFLKDEVLVHENWNSIGMIATGSHSFEVKRIVVKKNRRFNINSQFAILSNPIYQYPFLQFAEATLAVNSSGMAVHFLDLCETWFSTNATDAMLSLLKKSQLQLDETRQLFYGIINKSWDECLYDKVSPALLESITLISRRLALTARQVVDELYPCCGLRAANPTTEINRVWRNLHTASQHSLLNGYRG